MSQLPRTPLSCPGLFFVAVSLLQLMGCSAEALKVAGGLVSQNDGFSDEDGDGYPDNEDCNDLQAATNPSAIEICDGIDNNCDGLVDEGVTESFWPDEDGDGYGRAGTPIEACEAPAGFVPNSNDCDDSRETAFPGAVELCNELDDDCDSDVDEGIEGTWWLDIDSDGYGDPDTVVEGCRPTDSHVDQAGDCDDRRASVYPGATELCNELDDDCDGETDEGLQSTFYLDADSDGYGRVDQTIEHCSGPSGYTSTPGDCDDSNSAVHPSAAEVCNGIDDDCDALVDDADSSVTGSTVYYADSDGDGFGDASRTLSSCGLPSGYAADATDCDDSDATIHPAASEYCDGHDDDCDGLTDESDAVDASMWFQDGDSDGYGNSTVFLPACSQPAGYAASSTDCDDSRATVYPGAAETCNGIDDDCDSLVDDDDPGLTGGSTYYTDSDGDRYGDPASSVTACSQPSGTVTNSSDCNDGSAAVYPGATEICNSIDDDCDALVDDDDPGVTGTSTYYTDSDGDRYGNPASSVTACSQPSGTVTNSSDCNDGSAAVYPGATEICNSIDDDCDALVDDDDPGVTGTSTYYIDYDGDSYGSTSFTQSACVQPSGYVSSDTDCDDTASVTHPGASELCDDADNDCDGDIDEGVLGRTAACSAESCAQILDYGASIGDGLYYLDPDGSGASVWSCDMTTDGGGWTLVTDWNRTDDGDSLSDFAVEFDILQNYMGTYQTDSSSLYWQACSSSSTKWEAASISVSQDIVVPNDGEVLYEIDYEGVSMDKSGSWFWVESAGSAHNLRCWDHVDAAYYDAVDLLAMPGYTCWASTSPRTFSWSGVVQDDAGSEVDTVRLSSLHYDGCGDTSYLYLVELWVR